MEAGEGEEGRDCLLETQEESPSASAAAGEPSPPPANFSSSSAPLLPLGLTKARSLSPWAWCPRSGFRLSPPAPLPVRASSGLAAALWPHGDRLSVPLLLSSAGACGQAPGSLPPPSPGSFRISRGQEVGLRGRRAAGRRCPGASSGSVDWEPLDQCNRH